MFTAIEFVSSLQPDLHQSYFYHPCQFSSLKLTFVAFDFFTTSISFPPLSFLCKLSIKLTRPYLYFRLITTRPIVSLGASRASPLFCGNGARVQHGATVRVASCDGACIIFHYLFLLSYFSNFAFPLAKLCVKLTTSKPTPRHISLSNSLSNQQSMKFISVKLGSFKLRSSYVYVHQPYLAKLPP